MEGEVAQMQFLRYLMRMCKTVVLNQGLFCPSPSRYLAISRNIFGCYDWGEGVIASSRQGSEMLLTFYSAQETPTAKNYLAPKVSSAKVEKP